MGSINAATSLPFQFMLTEYFSDHRIIDQICKKRINLAGSRHDRQYINRLAGHSAEHEPNHPFYRLMPPRKQWAAFRPRYRDGGLNPDLAALKKAVRVLRHQTPEAPWVVELNRYIAYIRERAFVSQAIFSSPTVIPELKEKGGHEYRALSRFDVSDNLILCLFAKYLQDKFDVLFSDSSYAFRAVQNGHIRTHHDAFTAIWKLKNNSINRSHYVAECDIRGFFDTVDHGVALRAFEDAAKRVQLHPRAHLLFQAYLDCYSFPVNVLASAEPRLKQRDPAGVFKWPEEALRSVHNTDPRSLRIGVAQGGALSGIIANLIIDAADKCVEAETARLGAEIHYFRFCDDMVLLSPNRKDCQRVFDAYLQKLTELKLAYHEPKKTRIYSKAHWEHKSKAPYKWSGEKWFNCVPWVQFVGYQIRYDGLVRPRKGSVQKQCLKLVETTNNLKFGLIAASQTNPVRATGMQALGSLQAKLTAQGVGRVKGNETGPKPMCWASGFKGLHEKPIVPNSLRNLDRARAKQLRRFNNIELAFGTGVPRDASNRRLPKGYAFSYSGQFTNLDGASLIANPWRPHNFEDAGKYFLYSFRTAFMRFLRWIWSKLKIAKNH